MYVCTLFVSNTYYIHSYNLETLIDRSSQTGKHFVLSHCILVCHDHDLEPNYSALPPSQSMLGIFKVFNFAKTFKRV